MFVFSAEGAVQNSPLHCRPYFIFLLPVGHHLALFRMLILNLFSFCRLLTAVFGDLRVGDFFLALLIDSVLLVVVFTLINTFICGRLCYTYMRIIFV